MNVKSKCTIPANHFEYFIMGAKYHYSPPVQSTPSAYRHRAGSPLARTPREFIGDRALRGALRSGMETEGRRGEGDGEGEGERRWHPSRVERGRTGGGRGRRGYVRARGRGRRRNVCGNAGGGREPTRASAERGGTRGTCARTRVHTRVRTRARARVYAPRAERVRAGARAIRGMRPGLNYVPRNAFSRESHCERSV
jgi:hypothetical protein